MKILVTGATGFVGRALLPVLTQEGHQIRLALRNRGTGHNAAWTDYIEVGDICGNTDWRAVVAGVDAVVHLAARVHVMRDEARDPLGSYRRINRDGTESLALAAAAAGVPRLVFLSTVKVLGETSGTGAFTDADPPRPLDPYAISKWEAEQVLADLCGAGGMDCVILRPPLVYGPGVRGNFERLIRLCLPGLPLPLGAVSNRRSLLFVGNLCDAILQSLRHPAAAGRSFLLSDGPPLSTPDLLRRLGTALGRKPVLIPVPVALLRMAASLVGRREDFLRLCDSLCVDDSGFRMALTWRPRYTTQDGLAATVAAYRDREKP